MLLTRKVLALEDQMWTDIDKCRTKLGLLTTTAFIRMAIKEKLDREEPGWDKLKKSKKRKK